MPKTATKLREFNEMRARLLEVSKDMSFDLYLYPILLAKAGEDRVASGVALTVALALLEYKKKIPQNQINVAFRYADKFIDAIMPNTKIAAEAKVAFRNLTPVPKKFVRQVVISR